MKWAKAVNEYLRGYRTICTVMLGSLFNLVSITKLFVIPLDYTLVANLIFMFLAGFFRMLAADKTPLD